MINVEHDDPIMRTYILFEQTSHAVSKYANAYFHREACLSAIKFTVLRILAINGGTMRPSEIAEQTHRERHDITTLVDRMTKEGLVRAKRSNRDKRSVNITLTDEGLKVLIQAEPVARDIVNQVMSSISEGDAALLEKQLSVLRENVYHGLGHVAERSQPRPE